MLELGSSFNEKKNIKIHLLLFLVIDISQPSAAQVSASFTIGGFLDLRPKGSEHRPKTWVGGQGREEERRGGGGREKDRKRTRPVISRCQVRWVHMRMTERRPRQSVF